MIGKTVSHYRLLEKVGEGGMGVVYRAEDTRLSRSVAIKFLPPHLSADPDARRRFLQEARAASALNHPHIAVVHDIGETDDGHAFIVMAFHEGTTLQEQLSGGALPVEDALRIVRQVALALGAAHAAGIVHRDVKPGNILVGRDGHVRLADFGLARLAMTTRVTRDGTTMGTAPYMSPEQVRGEDVDSRSDVFSLGTLLYELLAGHLPFRGDHPQAVLYAIANTEPPPLPGDVPPAVAGIVSRALRKSPSERYAHASDLIADIDALYPSGTRLAAPRTGKNSGRRVLLGVASVALIAAAAFMGWRSVRGPKETVSLDARNVAVLDFRNLSGDPAMAWMEKAVPEMLSAALARSTEVSVLDRMRLAELLGDAGGEPSAGADDASSIDLARRASVGTAIVGDIMKSGTTIRVQSRLIDVNSGRILRAEFVEGNAAEDLFKMVAELTERVQTYLDIRAVGTPVSEAWIQDITSKSLDAYRHYVRGRSLLMQSAFAESRVEFEAAIAADSSFVMAYVDLTGACFNLDDPPCIGFAYERANRLRDRASPREKLYIDLIGAIIKDQSETQIQIATELIRQDPHGAFWHYVLGRGYYMTGRYEQAVEHWQGLYEKRWTWVWTYLYMSDALRRLQRYDDALRVVQTGFEITPVDRSQVRSYLHRYRGNILRDRGDYDGATNDYAESERLMADNPMLLFDRAVLRQKTGAHDEAIRLYREFLPLSENPRATEEAKVALRELGASP